HTPMAGSIQKTAGTTEDIMGIINNQADVMFTSPTAPVILRNDKKGDFHLRAMASAGGAASSTMAGYYTLPRDDVKQWADLKGKKVYADKPNMLWSKPISEALLKVNGMTKDDLDAWLEYLKTGDAFRDVKEGRVDSLIFVAGSGTTEMGETTGIYVIPYTPEEQKAIEELGFGFVGDTWPAGMFGNKVDTPTVMAPQTIFVSPDDSDDLIYTLCKMFFDNITEFQQSQKSAEGFSLDNALTQWAIPYHPGAIKYYKEKGIWGAAEDAKQKKLLALETP
ncbi:TAXI family TRAP transporter solute-binding subunit, partial [Bacteroidota bacterium]